MKTVQLLLFLNLIVVPIAYGDDFEFTLCSVGGDDCDSHSYNPDRDVQAIEVEVSIEQIDGELLSTSAFELALTYDTDFMTATSMEALGVLKDLNDGDGPSFFADYLSVADEGLVLGCIYSFSAPLEYIEFSDPEPVVLLTFETEELKDEEEESSTDLAWGTILQYTNQVLADFEQWTVNAVDLTLNLVPEARALFLRGDSDGNGKVFPLLDAIHILAYGFTGGDTPPCLDAADVDDDGEVFAALDALYLLSYGLTGGDEPPAPGPSECGGDPEDDEVGCETPQEDCP